MPRGLYRFHQSQTPHFITFTCYRRRPHLNAPSVRDQFVMARKRTRKNYGMFVYGFVVMPNHIHLLISEPQHGTIATVIQSLKIASAKRARTNQTPQDSPFWQKRYYDRNVRVHREFIENLKYIHRNPVKRGLVESPADWQWSSFRHYAEGIDCGVTIESWRNRTPAPDPTITN